MLSGARLVGVEGSLSRRRDFDITAWVAAALPAAAARLRYVRNFWINEPQFGKMDLHLWHQGDTFQQVQGSRRENEGARRRTMLLLEVVEPVVFAAPHLSHPPMFLFSTRGLTGLGFPVGRRQLIQAA